MVDFDILITGGVGVITTIVGSWATWVFSRKKYNAEVDGTKIENLAKIIDIQNNQIKNLQERLELTLERNKTLEQEVVELRRSMFNLMSNICLDLTCKHRVQEVKSRQRKAGSGE